MSLSCADPPGLRRPVVCSRFDPPSVFGRLLDPDAGHWAFHPVERFVVERHHAESSLVLRSVFETADGEVTLTDRAGPEPRPRGGAASMTPTLVRGLDEGGAGVGASTERSRCVQAPPRWFAPPSPAELDLLRLAVGPVLDIGCGPGRHVLALNRAGVKAVGIDVSATFVELARRRGATVIAGSIFDPGPDTGAWGTCLLLDGNIGIGARPEALLRRARELVGVDGIVLVEAAAPRAPLRKRELCVLVGDSIGPSFSWVDVGIDRLNDLAEKAGLNLDRTWSTEGRWFARLAT